MPEIAGPGDKVIRRRGQALVVNWVLQAYVVTKETMQADARRRCWICGDKFKIGDGMTVANTDIGNQLIHHRCWEKQQEGE